MKTEEDEAFDELAKKQGMWGGGYQAKKAMAAAKLQEPPSEWAGIKAILDEYGLQAIDFVADFKAALAQPAHCQCFACKDGVIHASDCAVHNGPAYPAGPCDCGVAQEPVAWMVYTQDGQSVYVTDNPTDIQKGQRALPLYTTPPKPAQEPVAHLWECLGRWSAYLVCNGKQADCAPPSWLVKAIQNATTPPKRPWVGLTAEDFSARRRSAINSSRFPAEFRAGARWADTKLKEKNT